MSTAGIERAAIALCTGAVLLLAAGCASRPPHSAAAAHGRVSHARPGELRLRTPEQIANAPELAPQPLQPVPVPLDSAVVGTRPPGR